ncbi:MAG: presenilin family intramembrane aspartyl protease [archaeon]
MESLKPLATEIGMFLTTEMIAVYVGLAMISAGIREEYIIESTGEGIGVFGLGMLFATLLILFIIKYLNRKIVFQMLFAWLIFVGSLFVFGSVLIFPLAALLAGLVVAARFLMPRVWVQNVAMILSIAGISPQLAMYFGTPTIIAILLLASAYDYYAVFKTKHMIKMFESLMKHETPFTFVIPAKGSMSGEVNGKLHKKKKKGQREYYLLGTGDIAFPTIFVVALLADYSPLSAAFAFAGAIVGMIVDHLILMKMKTAIPALPAIAVCSIAAFLLSLVV